MSSAISFNLDLSKILSSGNGLVKMSLDLFSSLWDFTIIQNDNCSKMYQNVSFFRKTIKHATIMTTKGGSLVHNILSLPCSMSQGETIYTAFSDKQSYSSYCIIGCPLTYLDITKSKENYKELS